jgi:hypothetical protein
MLRLAAAGLSLSFLAACTLAEGPPVVSPTKVFSSTRAPIRGADAKFDFMPVTGAPGGLLQTVKATIKRQAEIRHLTVVPNGDPTATYIVKGYLSAVGDMGGTQLVYVWDVYDRDGKRLRRISGQELGTGAVVDPWTGIREETVAGATRSMIDELVAWVD